jgi:hypothetical protein
VTDAETASTTSVAFNVHGVRLRLVCNISHVREIVAHTYVGFADHDCSTAGIVVRLMAKPGGVWLSDSTDPDQILVPDENLATAYTLERITLLIVRHLAESGTFVVHAAAVVHRGRALIISGPSGSGKTTLALGLLERGMSLLSDELAVVPPSGVDVLPYPRSLHVRPTTLELLDGLDLATPAAPAPAAPAPAAPAPGSRHKWSLAPDDLAQLVPHAIGRQAPLRFVVLLDDHPRAGRPATLAPISRATTVVELARATPALEGHFETVLARLSGLVAGASCAKLSMGAYASALDLIVAWLDDR